MSFESKLPSKISRREYLILTSLLSGLVIFMIMDIIYDLTHGATLTVLFFEIPIILLGMSGILFFLYQLRGERSISEKFQEKVSELHIDLLRMRRDNNKFLKEFYHHIMQQFEAWNLTQSEKEVGILILKGLSFKDISIIRNTSERTIRNQAVSIYNRSGMSGRHEFAAFFLKDMILDPQEITPGPNSKNAAQP